MRALPPRYKIDIRIKEGMHQSENAGEFRNRRLGFDGGVALAWRGVAWAWRWRWRGRGWSSALPGLSHRRRGVTMTWRCDATASIMALKRRPHKTNRPDRGRHFLRG
jgi:hypothetical protein